MHQTRSRMSLYCTVILEQEDAMSTLFPQSWEHQVVQNVLVY